MKKVLSILFLLILAASAFGQKTQQPAKSSKTEKPKQGKNSTQNLSGKQANGSAKSSKQTGSSTKSNKQGSSSAKKTTTTIAGTTKKPVQTKPRPKPVLTPVVPEDDKTRFDKAVAAPATTEKARLLKAFLRDFPESPLREEAFNYLITARAVAGNELLQSGDTAAGIESFKRAVEEAPQPVPDRIFNDVISKIPANLFYRDQRAAAIELAKAIEKKVAGNSKQLLTVAAFYLGIENGAEATRIAEAVVAAEPTSAAGYQALGLAHRLDFDLEEAERAYAKAAEVDPASVSAQRSLAEMKRALGKPDEAVTIYRSLLASDENDSVARGGLILALFDSGKQGEAETELAGEAERGSKNFGLFAGAAYWYAANNFGEKAVELAQKAIEIEPRYIWSHIALARGLMKQGKPVDAERVLIKARQYGNFPTLEYELASARFKAGLYREAVEELNKSFELHDGLIRTRLGGRVYKEEKNFQDLIAGERKASILEPAAADDAENSARLRTLFEITKKLESSPDETEIVALTDEFVKGTDKMKLHRQLHAANLLLQKNIALGKVAELVKASVGNVEAGLDVSAPGAAVMASELYESRTVAFSRNEVLVIPEVPRQTLSAILRGRIEELAGWTLYQQNNYPEAIVRLRRAISVLPDKSAWWRSSMWRLGAALEAEGKDKEALDSYIKSYVTDRPSPLRYSIIENVYRKVNGSTEGLEQKIGPNPIATVATTQQSVGNQNSAAPSAVDKNVPAAEPAGRQAEFLKIPPRQLPIKIESSPSADKLVASDTGLQKPTEQKPKPVSDDEKSQVPPSQQTDVSAVRMDAKNEKLSAVGENLKPADDPPTSAVKDRASEPVQSVKDVTVPKQIETEGLTSRAVVKPPEKPTKTELEPQKPTETPIQKASGSEPDLTAAKNETVATKSEPSPGEIVPVSAKPKDSKAVSSQPETKNAPVAETDSTVKNIQPESAPKTDSPAKDAKANEEPSNLLRDPFGTPEPKSPEATEKKPLIIVNDPYKPDEKKLKTEEKTPKTKDLFEPVIINVPRGTPADSAQKPKEQVDGAEKTGNSDPEKTGEEYASSGATRRRIIEGKDVVSDQKCSIDLSQDNIMLLSGGGSLGVLVSVTGDGAVKDITASTNSSRDIEVRAEPEIDGAAGRRFYVIKSISPKTGIYYVNFESPCGKREITVHVR